MNPDIFKKVFSLLPHPEGGYYKETYRSVEMIAQNALPARFPSGRAAGTAILFLLETDNFSTFHRIKSDECWHFYSGQRLCVYVIHPTSQLEVIKLGNDMLNGEVFQAVVPAGCWFAAAPSGDYAFVGCTVAPGFDFEDFELADAEILSKEYPQHAKLIRKYCR